MPLRGDFHGKGAREMGAFGSEDWEYKDKHTCVPTNFSSSESRERCSKGVLLMVVGGTRTVSFDAQGIGTESWLPCVPAIHILLRPSTPSSVDKGTGMKVGADIKHGRWFPGDSALILIPCPYT